MGQVFNNGPSKICGRQHLKNFLTPAEADHITLIFFKGSLSQILLGPFLNTLPHKLQELLKANEKAFN